MLEVLRHLLLPHNNAKRPFNAGDGLYPAGTGGLGSSTKVVSEPCAAGTPTPSTEWKEMERLLQESLKVLPPTDE